MREPARLAVLPAKEETDCSTDTHPSRLIGRFRRRWERLEEARRTVETAEADFEARLVALSAAVSRECAEDGIRILRLTGPTCSGKTTAAGKLTEALEAAGLSVYPISLDDFYLDRQELEERARARGGTPDYDSADTLDLGAMEACVRELRRTGETDIPVFNFTTGNRAGTRHRLSPPGKSRCSCLRNTGTVPARDGAVCRHPVPQRVYFGFARVGGSRRDFSAGGVAPSAPTGAGRGGTGRDPRLYPWHCGECPCQRGDINPPLCQRMRLSD